MFTDVHGLFMRHISPRLSLAICEHSQHKVLSVLISVYPWLMGFMKSIKERK